MWILFVLASFFIPLVMFNMIIAIMTDTFERVTNEMIVADGKELNLLILEQEEFMVWKRKKNVEEKWLHLHWA